MFEELKPHLVELRKRLFISVACVFVLFFACFGFNEYITKILTLPLERVLPQGANQVNFIELTEPFFNAVKVSFFTAFLLSMPVIFWQFWKFVAPGLYDNEKRLVVPFVVCASIMFLLGASFCYFIAVPMAFDFFVVFGQAHNLNPNITIAPYIDFLIKLMLAFGLGFELPIITFFLAKLGLVNDAMLKRHFRVAILVIFIFAAFMTPPDVLSQLLMAGPLCLLYGISIFVAKKVNPASKEDDENLEQDTNE
ncbi:twin-arginine translocase subunit TatC [Campylobacter sp. MIT 99-7217]|uniref:twin-arginine translocase subunit TatC n=1 Tax=Campylobacter sp. MIT 99-7217 TaxID=535091 RepID=UPI001159F6D6|nr:twin-arginine translocase subunit TatC [Campylobacter sp. MIT 99-7217]TQR33721.1 twin-arginine translocase subunit TatC [Campylobacter sp. MIT 99-7217]